MNNYFVEQGSGYPLILLHGNGEDSSYFVHTRLIASKILGSELVFIKGNHFIANKQPEAFNAAVLEFLQK